MASFFEVVKLSVEIAAVSGTIFLTENLKNMKKNLTAIVCHIGLTYVLTIMTNLLAPIVLNVVSPYGE
ncbi:MAG: hypothetical protein JWO06_2699 [Bacteroidota bacterium]|nr:hypothetical protein [Bacteroidota bacterium]